MKHVVLLIFFLSLVATVKAQQAITSYSIHAHNDYVNRIPFYEAYRLGAGSIEADIFLRDGELYVAHEEESIKKGWTLDSMYLRPLQKIVVDRSSKTERPLQLLIDLKTEGEPTLNTLVKKLMSYPPEVFAKNRSLQIVISGNVPDPARWSVYPSFIFFDGRPNIVYSAEQLQRIGMISEDLKKYTEWNGKGLIVKPERDKITTVIASVHKQGKKFRFWGTPDQVNAWKTFITLGVDYIGTDRVDALAEYIRKRPSNEYTATEARYIPYQPRYINNDKRSKVKNIILMIGDGMGVAQIYSGYTANRGALNLFNMVNIGFSVTYSSDSYITDSAAGGTAMATGTKTNNRYVGVDSAGVHHRSIPEAVKPSGVRSALISAGDITDATPAAFYAQQPERAWSEAIAKDFLSNPVDILIGGGYNSFVKRSDNQNLFTILQKEGYTVSGTFEAIDTIKNNKFAILDDKAVVSKAKGRGDFLSRSLTKSIGVLKKNKAGFFIMAEGAQIDYGGHSNEMGYVAREMVDFDKAIGEAMRFADENGETLIVVTADHETGGLSLLDGDIQKGYIDSNFSSNDHSAVMVPVFAYGPHSQDFRGVYQNTAIFDKIMKIFELYKK